MAIVRGLVGLIIGIGYGLLAGGLTLLLAYLLIESPGPMIPDQYGWAQIAATFTALIAGVFGALVGIAVGLFGLDKLRGGAIGGGLGVVITIFLAVTSLREGGGWSWSLWKDILGAWSFVVLVFPVGLTLTGIVVSVVASKLKV